MSTREVPGAAFVAPSRAHDGSIMETYTVAAHVASLTDAEAGLMLATVPASAIGSPLHLALVERTTTPATHYADVYNAGDIAATSRDALRKLLPLADEWVRACDARTDAAWDAAHVASAENMNALILATTRVRASYGAYRDALASVTP